MLRSTKGRRVIKAIPFEKMLFEFDGPFGKIKNEIATALNIETSYIEIGRVLGINDMEGLIMSNFKEWLSRKNK